MCIRDRGIATQIVEGAAVPQGQAPQAQQAPGGPQGGGDRRGVKQHEAETVSYTHLAETVLRPEKVLLKCFRTGVRLPSAPPDKPDGFDTKPSG